MSLLKCCVLHLGSNEGKLLLPWTYRLPASSLLRSPLPGCNVCNTVLTTSYSGLHGLNGSPDEPWYPCPTEVSGTGCGFEQAGSREQTEIAQRIVAT
jgi:hypothetical protein